MENKEGSDSENLIKNALELLANLKLELKDARKENRDMSEVIQKIKGDLEKLHDVAESVYQETGMDKDEVQEYIKDPKNFSNDEWALLSNIKEETESCKKEIIKSVEKETISDIVGKNTTKKKKKRKKRWIES